MILATADTRTTREQMIPKSKQSNITHFCINVPHRTQPSTHPLPVPSSQQGLLEAKNCSSPVSLRPQITLGFHPYYSLANLRISVDFEDSSASLVGCFDLIGLAQGLTDSPEALALSLAADITSNWWVHRGRGWNSASASYLWLWRILASIGIVGMVRQETVGNPPCPVTGRHLIISPFTSCRRVAQKYP